MNSETANWKKPSWTPPFELLIRLMLGGGAVDSGQAFTWNCPAAFDHFTGDDKFLDAFLRRQGVHRVKQQLFENHHQPAGADFALDGLRATDLSASSVNFSLTLSKSNFF